MGKDQVKYVWVSFYRNRLVFRFSLNRPWKLAWTISGLMVTGDENGSNKLRLFTSSSAQIWHQIRWLWREFSHVTRAITMARDVLKAPLSD